MLMLVFVDCRLLEKGSHVFPLIYMLGDLQPHSGHCKWHVVYSAVVLQLINWTELPPSALD